MKRGFTFIEIIFVLAIIGILVTIIIPNFRTSTIRAKEAVLKENLFIIRDSISKYYHDKKKYPISLDELVSERYLKEIPIDPITNKREWEIVHPDPDNYEDFDPDAFEWIIDVRSKSTKKSLDGKKYNEW